MRTRVPLHSVVVLEFLWSVSKRQPWNQVTPRCEKIMRRRPRGTLFFVRTVYMRPPGTLVSFGRCVFRWPAQARVRRHRRRPASPPSPSSPRVIGPRTSSSSPRRQNSSKSGPYESVCMQACKRARRCQWAVVNLGCVFSPFLPILVFGGENKPKKRQKKLTGFM